MFKKYTIVRILCSLFLFNSCTDKDGSINFFPVSKDQELGAQVAAQIANDPTNYPLLDTTGGPNGNYAKAHSYLNNIINKIKASGKLDYKDEFAWRVRIIKDDNTLNAFCTPGGYIYVYSGLIKYLDKTDHLAGVMGHEMGHAAHRHSTDAMTQQYGVQILLDVVLGKSSQSQIVQMAANLASLKYSRSNESEADASSVDYLAGSGWACDGAAGFFEKLINEGKGSCDALTGIFSTHPCPDNRVQAIRNKAALIQCSTSIPSTDPGYATFKSYLP